MDSCKDSSWWVVTLPALLSSNTNTTIFFDTLFLSAILAVIAGFISTILLAWAFSSGGPAWFYHSYSRIPGPRGLPLLGSLLDLSSSMSLPHRKLASLARSFNAKQLMAFSIGATPAVVSSDPIIARELLCHTNLSDRPLKQSARELMFGRAIGFAPNGAYWRLLRRTASSHLFAPRRIASHAPNRSTDCSAMVKSIASEQMSNGAVILRPHLQAAALNNIMGCVFGRRYEDNNSEEVKQLNELVREGFELLGAFNWSDHLPWLNALFDPSGVSRRCAALVPRVRRLVKSIIDEHTKRKVAGERLHDNADFVDVLLSLDGEEKLDEEDMIAVLWEMIFRGTDTVALLTEWVIAELVLNPIVQARLRSELDSVVGPDRVPTESDISNLPYLNAVIKETLRAHPPGPLLSWARLSTADVQLSNGMVVPTGTTVMVNMWAITHDPEVWDRPEVFDPTRFMPGGAAAELDVRGGDLRLAPFGAGRRVCPGKNLGYMTSTLWVATLVHGFEWAPAEKSPVVLDEVLKLSCEMKSPLAAVAVHRSNLAAAF